MAFETFKRIFDCSNHTAFKKHLNVYDTHRISRRKDACFAYEIYEVRFLYFVIMKLMNSF